MCCPDRTSRFGLLALGDLFLWLDDPSYAESLFAQAAGLGGESADAHVGLARAYFARSAEHLWRPSPKMRLNLLLAASNELDVARRLNPGSQVSLGVLAEDLRMGRMRKDSLQVASAIALFMRDTARSPGQAYQWLFTDSTGRMPRVDEAIDFATLAAPCSDFLVSNAEGITAWHGPYLLASGSDAWENRYLISLAGSSGEKDAEPKITIISAGPNGMLETAAGSVEPGGDDLRL